MFTDPARASTLLLTSLMVIGLIFFIRASTKDRIEVVQFGSVQEADALRQAVMKYFYSRAYQASSSETADTAAMPAKKKKSEPVILNGTTLVGIVSPSLFLAVFLSGLAAVGLACLSLVVATLFPAWGGWLLALVGTSPLAGIFYWNKSSRPETIVLRVDSLIETDANNQPNPEAKIEADQSQKDHNSNPQSPQSPEKWISKLTVKGHRDELADLERAFSQPELAAWAGLDKIAPG